MATSPPLAGSRSRPKFVFGLVFGCSITIPLLVVAGFARTPSEVVYYSTAAPPNDYPGPAPVPPTIVEPSPAADEPIEPVKVAEPIPTRVAATERNPAAIKEKPARSMIMAAAPVAITPIAEAKARIAACAKTFAATKDYTCMFFKRERVAGQLTPMHTMHMKGRGSPHSIYFKFVTPTAGREAIYVAGGFGGKAVVHDVGIGKLLAGTLKLDPTGSMAMEANRHPITEAGLGQMIETIVTAWDRELTPEESKVILHPNARVGNRECLMIESIHPKKRPDFLFHMVKVYIDKDLNLPIRFEAYDWPKGGKPADLMEEYTYSNLKINVGLTPRDFDPSNKSYSFGRF